MSRICEDAKSLVYDKDLSYPIDDSPFYKVMLRNNYPRSRSQNRPEDFIEDHYTGDSSGDSSTAERKVTLRNRDTGGGTSGGVTLALYM